MALSANEYLQSLLRNITDYYTARYSSDTDLYQILRMYSNEFYSGSVAIDTVRDNAYVVSCEEDSLFNNFGTLFDATLGSDQSIFEDRYLTWTSGSITNSQPGVYEDITTVEAVADWEPSITWPATTALHSPTYGRFIGSSMTDECVYWSGSFWSSCAASQTANSYYAGAVQYQDEPRPIVQYNPGNSSAPWRFHPENTDSIMTYARLSESVGDFSSIPFAWATPREYLGRGQYSTPWLTYVRVSSTNTVGVPPQGTQTSPVPWIPRLNLYTKHPQKSFDGVYSSFYDDSDIIMYLRGYVDRYTNDPGARLSHTKAVEFHNNVYFGFGGTEYDSYQYNDNRIAAGLTPYPKYAADKSHQYPFLFKYTPSTEETVEVGLAAIVSSGSLGHAAPYDQGWQVNAIGIYDNRVHLDYSSGSITSPSGQKRHYLAAYDGISWSGSNISHTAALTAPVGTVVDLGSYNDKFYAAVYSGSSSNQYYIAQAERGLKTLVTTEGHWKFNQNFVDETDNAHTLTSVDINASDFVSGLSEAGLTSVSIPDGDPKGTVIAAADATDFDMGTGDFTIEAIVKVNSTASSIQGIVHKWDLAGPPYLGYRLGLQATGVLRASIGDAVDGAGASGVTPINDEKWHYVALVIDRGSNTGYLYLDGILDKAFSTAAVTGSLSVATKPLEIGKTEASYQFTGDIDEICISKEALSAADIWDRHARIRNKDMTWNVHTEFTSPLKRFFNHDNQFMISAGNGQVHYLTSSDTWAEVTSRPTSASPSGYSAFAPSSGSVVYGVHKDHMDITSNIFNDVTYRYVYPPAVSTRDFNGPTSVPGYRKQLDFLVNASMFGSTREGINRVVNAYTLINPDIAEISTLPGWKLKTFSGSVSRVSSNVWQFDVPNVSDLFRPNKWNGSYLTLSSGSTSPEKVTAGYLVLVSASNNEVTVAPIHDTNLDWDLRRLEA